MDDPVQNQFLKEGDPKKGSGHTLAGVARTGMVITFALVQGIVIIGAIFAFLVFSGEPAPPNDAGQPKSNRMMPGVGLLLTATACGVAMVVPGVMRRKSEAEFKLSGERIDLPIRTDQSLSQAAEKLAGGSQTASLIGQAVLEGAAVANLILFMIDEHLIHIALAAVSVVGILLLAPTVGKLKQSIEDAAA